MAQQIQDLKEQLNTLKAETGKGADVTVTLQLVRQLASASQHLRDPFAILAAFQKLADEARVSADPSASRYEATLRQSRPLSSSLDFGNIILRLLASKEESEVVNSITKMMRQQGPSSFHSMPGGTRRNVRQYLYGVSRRVVLVGASERGEYVLVVASAGTSKNIVRHFDYETMSYCNKRTCIYFFFVLFFISKLLTPLVCQFCGV